MANMSELAPLSSIPAVRGSDTRLLR
jgi:hypothetical protein